MITSNNQNFLVISCFNDFNSYFYNFFLVFGSLICCPFSVLRMKLRLLIVTFNSSSTQTSIKNFVLIVSTALYGLIYTFINISLAILFLLTADYIISDCVI